MRFGGREDPPAAKVLVIPTGAGANATAQWRNLLSLGGPRCPCGDSHPRLSSGPEVSGRKLGTLAARNWGTSRLSPDSPSPDSPWPSTKAVSPSKCVRRRKCQHKKLPKKEKL